MSKDELSKREAIILITPVVDNEASDREKEALLSFIQHNEEVRRQYESAQRIKQLLSSRCPRTKAPDSLRDKVQMMIKSRQMVRENMDADDPIYDIPCPGSIKADNEHGHSAGQSYPLKMSRWMFTAAACFLILLLVGGIYYYSNGTLSAAGTASYNIEEYAFEHFRKYEGDFVEPHISTASIASAENELAQNYNMRVTVPSLSNAEFKGVVYSEFVPDYEAPMLEYYQSSEDQYIYIFVFRIDQLEEFGKLVRNEEAVRECARPDNFHIRNVNGKHVVSWKWDDVWYAAISNHSGDTIASLVDFPNE